MNRIKTLSILKDKSSIELSSLAKSLDLLESTVQLLHTRELKTKSQIQKFLSPGKHNFLDPYLLSGIDKLKERLTLARENNQNVVIYGDYDADGICGSTIMYFALKNFGIDAQVYIPERVEGYGLSIDNIEKIAENLMPDLIITVDCGISSHLEVDYIHDLGIDIIVTDHHELPSVLPSCVIVNPKLDDSYPYDNLCGAAVALKVAYALDSKYAPSLIDFAAIATIADSVPLVNENRDIAAEGLKMMSGANCRLCIKKLLNSEGQVTSQTVAYSIAPKINAAGRMGNAALALKLFTSTNEFEIDALAKELIGLNGERQSICGELFDDVLEMARTKYHENIIMLHSESFAAGFTGIAASKLSEQYCKPVIIFSQKGEFLKGSARSFGDINIYSAIDSCKDLVMEFGGHAQAAGVSLKLENFESFFDAVNLYLKNNYKTDDFLPSILVTDFVDEPISDRFVDEISLFEPFGVGNAQPLFAYKTENVQIKSLKDGTSHLLLTTDAGDMVFFSGAKYNRLLESTFTKTLVFEPSFSLFKGRKYRKNYIKALDIDFLKMPSERLECIKNSILALKEPSYNLSISSISTADCKKLLDSKVNGYGTCFILNDIQNLDCYPEISNYRKEIFMPLMENCVNSVLIAPIISQTFGFDEIVHLDEPLNVLGIAQSVKVNNQIKGYDFLQSISTNRDELLQVYFFLKDNGNVRANSSVSLYLTLNPPFEASHFIFAVEVFCELGLTVFNGNSLVITSGRKAKLENSTIYTKLSEKLNNLKS